MSFLAQLRQQLSNEQGLKLCYVLQVRQQPEQSVSLSLSLVEYHQGQPIYPGKPYFLQVEHLQRPPPFLAPSDIPLLQMLGKALPRWIQQSKGGLPEFASEEFIQGLIDSQRCFIETEKQVWFPVKLGGRQAVELFWDINNTGDQQLRWRSQMSGTVFCVGPIIFVYDICAQSSTQNYTLSATTNSLTQEAIKTATMHNKALSPQAIESFLSRYQDRWQEYSLPLPEILPRRDVVTTVTPVLYCYSQPASICLKTARNIIELRFRYSSQDYSVTLSANAENNDALYWSGTELVHLTLQPEHERLYQQQLAPFLSQLDPIGLIGASFQWHSSNKNVWQNLLVETRLQLEAEGFQFLIELGFRHHYVVADSWQVNINDDTSDNSQKLSLQLSVAGAAYNLSTLLGQLHDFNTAQQRGERAYFELPDGRLLLLPSEELTGLISDLGDWFSHPNDEFRVPNSQLYRLHDLHEKLPADTQWQGDIEQLNQAIKLHQNPVILDSALCGVKAELRPYQWLGVCWLQHLKQHQVNGLLADDMGLGKTLQALSHLSLEQHQGELKQPALVIAPTSLLHNWSAEIKRFTPHLQHLIIHGPQRHQYWTQLNDYHILISSYQSVANDLKHWQRHVLSWVILDEAQVIKNPRTRASQAVRQLDSAHRLCLSGTPVENHLGELWSLLDFLMPDCLGSHKAFKSTYQKPIEEDGNHDKLQKLLQRIAPFMLRRSKDQVAQDLPAKTEIHETISLNDDQQAFYEKIKSTGWQQLQEDLSDELQDDRKTRGQQQILLLTALLKLRQVCCDPQLLGEHGVSSAKREHCIEMISKLVAENRAILVFSQFTSMLDLLATDLNAQSIPYLMLTGQTRKRQQMVDAFQKGDAPVFLISLKAGGVGLNLTRADTVIHYDPWWNNAAEQQATDRAHRIGQNKPVFVYKLIAENTIEEKIAQLQQRKALLSQHVKHRAQVSGSDFALKLEDLLALWQEESPNS
ncbi:MAG: superfamily II DNA or RNA helicase [Cellvibrionaceae bacterium]|jgi:superfamily II DNA or RNA helicase